MENKPRYVVGIDPGKKTGYAIYDRENDKMSDIGTLDFWSIYEKLITSFYPKLAEIIIEVPRTKQNWQKSKHQITSANIGGVYREAELLTKGLELAGYKVTTQHPKGKLNHKQVVAITKYEGKTNEHSRDAIMLCWRK